MDKPFFIGASGALIGAGAGAAANLLRNGGSLLARGSFASCILTPFSGNVPLQTINNVREVFIPAILLEWSSWGFAFGNNYFDRTEKEAGIIGFGKTYWNRYYKKNISRSFHNFTAAAVGMVARGIFQELLQEEGNIESIDISGHALMQVFYTLEVIQLLRMSEEQNRPWQKTALKALAIGIGVTDAIWMYNTTSNCHSVADVAIGMGLAAGGDYAASGLGWCTRKIGSGIYRGVGWSVSKVGRAVSKAKSTAAGLLWSKASSGPKVASPETLPSRPRAIAALDLAIPFPVKGENSGSKLAHLDLAG